MVLLDQQGAAGHSDNGYGYMVAQDDWSPGARRRARVDDSGPPMPGPAATGSARVPDRPTGRSTSDTSLTPMPRPACPHEEQYAYRSAGDARTWARVPTRSCASASTTRCRCWWSRPTMTDLECKSAAEDPRATSKLPEGQPRYHGPLLHLGRAWRPKAARRLRRQGALGANRRRAGARR